MENNGNRLPILEALILSSPEPLPAKKIIEIIQDITPSEIDKTVTELNAKYLSTDASFRIRKIANGYQFYVTENYSGYVEDLFTRKKTQRLTRAALETLAIIAYRQPVTRVDIEMIRGVSSDSAIRTLLERKFITLAGRAKTIGRPLLYSTADEFLKYFGLDSLNDLPKMEEIEELLSAKEPDIQQTLSLDSSDNDSDNKSAAGGSSIKDDVDEHAGSATEFEEIENLREDTTDSSDEIDIEKDKSDSKLTEMEEEEEPVNR